MVVAVVSGIVSSQSFFGLYKVKEGQLNIYSLIFVGVDFGIIHMIYFSKFSNSLYEPIATSHFTIYVKKYLEHRKYQIVITVF